MAIAPLQTASQEPLSHQAAQSALILGIESSCDETAAAIIERRPDGETHIRASIIASQDEVHRPFGGVVPEIAARAHMQKIDSVIARAMSDAGCDYSDLSAVAATAGPGLIGGVIAGLMAAKGLALSLDIPLIAVNHLEGHAVSPRLAAPCEFPYLLLLVSGGHTQLLSVEGLGQYRKLGSTVDDAAGEAFDKTAKVMELGFPGGPKVEAIAKNGDAAAIKLPRPFRGTEHANFSFAGLKTAVARAFDASDGSDAAKADIAASFQRAVCEVLCDRTRRAMTTFKRSSPDEDTPYRFVVAGGVAANTAIRTALQTLCADEGFSYLAPPHKYCTDNAAMIALAGLEYFVRGHADDLSAKARPRWPLDAEAALHNPSSGSGKKGPKS